MGGSGLALQWLLMVLLPATVWRLLPSSQRPVVPSLAGGGLRPCPVLEAHLKSPMGLGSASVFSAVNTLPIAWHLKPGPQGGRSSSLSAFSLEVPCSRCIVSLFTSEKPPGCHALVIQMRPKGPAASGGRWVTNCQLWAVVKQQQNTGRGSSLYWN